MIIKQRTDESANTTPDTISESAIPEQETEQEQEEQEQQEQQQELKNKEVFCPYCQGAFDMNQVMFRATEVAADDQENPDSFYVARKDDNFSQFWEDTAGWGNATNMREFSWGYAALPEEDEQADNGSQSPLQQTSFSQEIGTPVSQVKFCLLEIGGAHNHPTDPVTYEGGYAVALRDDRGKVTKKRVCPHCHSLLPEHYGKTDTHFFSVIGTKGSGKTIFLSKFFSTAEDILYESAGLRVSATSSLTRFCADRSLDVGEPLRKGTIPGRIYPPIFLNFMDKAQRNHTCVFYDIAGENCKEDGNFGKHGIFVENSDGIIMLISPKQIPELEGIHDDDIDDDAKITETLNALASYFILPKISKNDESRLPPALKTLRLKLEEFLPKSRITKSHYKLAVTVSKSDLFKGAKRTGRIDSTIDACLHQGAEIKTKKKGYRMRHGENIHAVLLRLLLTSPRLTGDIADMFKHSRFFAVSALGASPKKEIITVNESSREQKFIPDGTPLRVEEPFLWILSELGIILKID